MGFRPSGPAAPLAALLLVAGLSVLPASALGSGATPPGSAPVPHAALAAMHHSTGVLAPRPQAVGTLSIPGLSPAAAHLNWSGGGLGFTSYTVEFSSNGSAGPWSTASVITTQSTTSFGATGLTPGATYWWRVFENDGFFGTSYSNVVNATQPALANLTYSYLTSTDVQFNWTNSATYAGGLGFVSYQLYEVVGGAAPSLAATVTSEATKTATVTGLASGTGYLFFLNTTDCVAACGTGTPVESVTTSPPVTLGTPLPLSASVTPSRSVVDAGQLDQFTCTPSGGTSPFAFVWDLGNGTFVSAPPTVSASFSVPGPVTVTCRVDDATRTTATSAVTVTVAPRPTVNVSVSPAAVDLGQSPTFVCSPSAGVPPFTVVWSFGDGQSSSLPTTSHGYPLNGSFLATCVATDSVGTSASASVTVNVSRALAVRVGVSASPVAPTTTVTFTAIPANGSGSYLTFNWSFGDASYANLSSASITHAFTAAGNFSVLLLVSDSHGASKSASVTVQVIALSAALITPLAAATAGSPVHLEVGPSGGAGGPYNVTWFFGDGTSAYGAAVNHTFHASGTFAVSVRVMDRLGAARTVALGSIALSAAPAPPPPVSALELLVLGIGAGLIAAVTAFVVRRRAADRAYPALAGRVPTASPARLVGRGRRCRVCGHANTGIRESCEACGSPLRGRT